MARDNAVHTRRSGPDVVDAVSEGVGAVPIKREGVMVQSKGGLESTGKKVEGGRKGVLRNQVQGRQAAWVEGVDRVEEGGGNEVRWG